MGEALNTAIRAAAVAATLMLAACGSGQETGPDPVAESPAAPEIAPRIPAAVADPGAVRALVDFTGADTDRDGRISSAEYAAASTRMFGAMDVDDDGAITADEMETAQVALKLPGAGTSAKIIAAADNDGDGKLTLAEFVARSNARFTEMDKNRDGLLDGPEWTSGHPGFGQPPANAGTPPAKAAPRAG